MSPNVYKAVYTQGQISYYSNLAHALFSCQTNLYTVFKTPLWALVSGCTASSLPISQLVILPGSSKMHKAQLESSWMQSSLSPLLTLTFLLLL